MTGSSKRRATIIDAEEQHVGVSRKWAVLGGLYAARPSEGGRLVRCIECGCSTHQTSTMALPTNTLHGRRGAEVDAIIIVDVKCTAGDVVRCKKFLENDSA